MTLQHESSVVSRTEVALAVRHAFGQGAVSVDDLLRVARRNAAREEVLDALQSIPEHRRFTQLNQIWGVLPPMPVTG